MMDNSQSTTDPMPEPHYYRLERYYWTCLARLTTTPYHPTTAKRETLTWTSPKK